ncbi:hypothetical protein HHK36_012323 [Tetracentron sinense]|uniref:Heparan-alpha-glucosaminide N-acetyltransferase catalytic domain-containing protein n=1 Tax=Tetracentron sinense TaxID=13715 RepID=A0A834Z8I2_TETSI|nr:hypothetical protein HHK36_012323 [Tetracentron sinense]
MPSKVQSTRLQQPVFAVMHTTNVLTVAFLIHIQAGEDRREMSTVVLITEERTPLLQTHSSPVPHGDPPREDDEIIPSSSLDEPDEPKPNSTDPNQRLVSLDVFRGLTVALMILVDDAGGAFPSINHSPWFGVTLADFVVPFFLFVVGVSIGLVFKGTSDYLVNLFVFLEKGGFFHGRNHLTYGVDVDQIRWLGVLQRISIGYLLAAISEIWLVSNTVVDSAMAFVRRYYMQWIIALLLCAVYMCLLYGLYVPDWEFEVPSLNSTLTMSNYGSDIQIVHCGVRGNLEPPCNAVGLIDRYFLGEKHLYQHPVYRRTKECSVNSPDYGPLPTKSPGWCLAPFDPEGILSSLMASITCFVGLHYGHIILHFKVDVQHFRKPTVLLQWIGMNALIVYALAACELFPAAIQGFYWRSPENNLILHCISPPTKLHCAAEKKMASEEANTEVSDAHTSNNQAIAAGRPPNTQGTSHTGLGRALAQRALTRSNRRRGGDRKAGNNDSQSLQSLPSRLSKVSLADDTEK